MTIGFCYMSNLSGRLKVSQRPQRVVGHRFDSQIRETFCWIQPMFLCISLGFIYGFSINFLRFEAGSGWWFQTDPQGHSEHNYMVIQESSRLETSAWFKRFNHLFSLTKRQKLVGGFNLPLRKMMEWVRQLGWFSIPNCFWKVIQKSMVPVTTNQFAIAFPKSPSPATISRMPARRVAIGPWRPTRGQPPRDEIPGPPVELMSHSGDFHSGVMGCQ
jgi:hypothetical protein